MSTMLQGLIRAPFLREQVRSASRIYQPQIIALRSPVRNIQVRMATSKPAPYPPKTRHHKAMKGRIGGTVTESKLHFGQYGLKVLSAGRISYQTLEAARRVLSRKTKGHARLWVRAVATIPITKKPLEVRMGKGKGSIAGYIARVKAGQVLFELDGLSAIAAKQALIQAGHKIGIKTKTLEWS